MHYLRQASKQLHEILFLATDKEIEVQRRELPLACDSATALIILYLCSYHVALPHWALRFASVMIVILIFQELHTQRLGYSMFKIIFN